MMTARYAAPRSPHVHENLPAEILTGTVTKDGQRELADWKTYQKTKKTGVKVKKDALARSARTKATSEKARSLCKQIGRRSSISKEHESEVYSSEPQYIKQPDSPFKIKGSPITPTYKYKRGDCSYFDVFDGSHSISSKSSICSTSLWKDSGDNWGSLNETEEIVSVAETSPHEASQSHESLAAVSKSSWSQYRTTKYGAKKQYSTELKLPPISPARATKYFGEQSKSMFYDTYRVLDRKRKVLSAADDELLSIINDPYSDMTITIPKVMTEDVSEQHTTSRHRRISDVTIESALMEDADFIVEDDSSIASSVEMNPIADPPIKLPFDPASPRAKYLAGCLKLNLPPRAAMILRNSESSMLWLDHQGMGDKLAILLAEGLNDIPSITSINLKDNKLTDKGLTPIINSIAVNPNIRELDISLNKVDSGAADALASYLSQSGCPLERLVVRNANVDDRECHHFVQALSNNRNLRELDLSENLLGKDENLNAVKPDIVTGGESLAGLIRDGYCPISTLKVAWNMIRMEGALELCNSIAISNTLVHLDISFNAIGREGGIALGTALLDNKVLRELYIQNNGIESTACYAICIGIRENHSLQTVCMDGNPLGEQGGRMIMTVPVACGMRVQLSAKNCDVVMKQKQAWFDRSEPVGTFELDMEDGYERAICYDIMDIIARHPSLIFENAQILEDDGRTWREISLVRYDEKQTEFSEADMENLTRLRSSKKLADNIKLCIASFQAFDTDGSGELNEEELMRAVESVGFQLSAKQRSTLMATYDTDKSGEIQLEEFVEFIREVGRDAEWRIHDIETIPRIALSTSPTTRFIPPRHGKIRLTIVDTYIVPEGCRALSSEQTANISRGARHATDTGKLVGYCVQSERIRLEEAEDLFQLLVGDTGDVLGAITKVLPQLANPAEAKRFIATATKNDKLLKKKVNAVMGNAMRPLMGVSNGFYSLDLSKESDRTCMTRLLELSTTSSMRRQHLQLGDVSQDGNWSCFRNEYFAGKNIELTKAFLTPMPKTGKMEFDFICIEPVDPSAVCIGDKKIVGLLVTLGMLEESELPWAYELLKQMKSGCAKSLVTLGAPYWQADPGRARLTAEYLHRHIYSKLASRSRQLERAVRREQEVYRNLVRSDTMDSTMWGAASSVAESSVLGSADGDDDTAENEEEILEELEETENVEGDTMSSDGMEAISSVASPSFPSVPPSHHSSISTLSPTAAALSEVRSIPQRSRAGTTVSVMTEDLGPIVINGFAATKRCVEFIDKLEHALNNRWLRSRHVALITRAFRCGTLKKSDFGTYRVELIILLLHRIKDLHNIECVLSALSPEEHAMLVGRVGFLVLFNPLKPEGAVELDMSCWEQAQVAKMLVHFATIEPGTNWIGQKFRYGRQLENSPGWELPVTWFTEEGLPKQGILATTYYSGLGLGLQECMPVRKLRDMLMSLVQINSDLIQMEGDDENGDKECEFPCLHYALEDANASLKSKGIEWTYNPVHAKHA